MTITESAVEPRARRYPMSFNAWEFVRGALLAWVTFNGLVLVLAGLSELANPNAVSIYLILALFAGTSLTYSLLSVIAWSPAALLFALLLRPVPYRWLHGTAFALFGALAGGITWLFLGFANISGSPESLSDAIGEILRGQFEHWITLGPIMAVAALAGSFAWLWTTHPSHRKEKPE